MSENIKKHNMVKNLINGSGKYREVDSLDLKLFTNFKSLQKIKSIIKIFHRETKPNSAETRRRFANTNVGGRERVGRVDQSNGLKRIRTWPSASKLNSTVKENNYSALK